MKSLLFLIVLMFSISIFGVNYKKIETNDVKKLIDTKGDYTLIDSLTPIHYAIEYVPTAINIPNNQVKSKINLLPKDKSKMLIFYCMGPQCIFSKNNAKEAMGLGYTNVYVWNKGLPDWKLKGYKTTKGSLVLPNVKIARINSKELNASLDKYVLVSLFNGKTNKVGLIPNSKIVPITKFMENYTVIPKDKKVVFYSLHGKLGLLIGKFLVSKGYSKDNLFYLKGGVLEWKKSGFKVE
jgi:rhodanese-related sulfurtransferase